MLEQSQLPVDRRVCDFASPLKLVTFDLHRSYFCQQLFLTEKLVKVIKHLFVPQPRPLVCLRIFHVAFAEFPESNLDRLLVNSAQDLRLSECNKIFGIAPVGTLRRFLNSLPIWIVIIDPVDFTSFVYSHLQLALSLCQPRRVF